MQKLYSCSAKEAITHNYQLETSRMRESGNLVIYYYSTMSKQQQVEKNLALAEELADYMVNNPNLMEDLPKSASYVAFSSTDTALNKVNGKLIKGLLEEGKKVLKAIQTNDKKNPWTLTPVVS
jgi:hypothetical protein